MRLCSPTIPVLPLRFEGLLPELCFRTTPLLQVQDLTSDYFDVSNPGLLWKGVGRSRKSCPKREKEKEKHRTPSGRGRRAQLHSPLLERLFLHDICTPVPLYTVQGIPSFCLLLGVLLEPRLLTPRPCHPPPSLLTWYRVKCRIKHLIIICQTGAASQSRQPSMACYLRLINQRTCERKSQQPRQKDSDGTISATFRSQPYRVPE